MPKFSIIVPVYKVEEYLDRCIQSILKQTFTDFEVILVDDGSPDNSGIICDNYAAKDNRIVVLHQKNQGVSAARNNGLDIAQGEYICFVDSDDWIEQEMLAEIEADISNKSNDVVIWGVKNIYNDRIYEDNINIEENTEKFKEALIVDELQAYAWNKCYKISIFGGDKFPLGMCYEDLFFIPQLVYKAESISVIKKALYNYNRQNMASITNNLTPKTAYNIFTGLRCNAEFALAHELKRSLVIIYKVAQKAIECLILNYKNNSLSAEQCAELKEKAEHYAGMVFASADVKKRYKLHHDLGILAKYERNYLKFLKHYLLYYINRIKYILGCR